MSKLLILLVFVSTFAQAKITTIMEANKLRLEVNQIMGLKTKKAIVPKLAKVWKLIDFYDKNKVQEQQVYPYLKFVLRYEPWHLPEQLRLAKMLATDHKKDQAIALALEISKIAEDDKTYNQALKLFSLPAILKLKTMISPIYSRVIVLSSVGNYDEVVINDLKLRLRQVLGQNIIAIKGTNWLPLTNQDAQTEWVKSSRAGIIRDKNRPVIKSALKKHGLTLKDLNQTNNLLTIMGEVIGDRGKVDGAALIQKKYNSLKGIDKRYKAQQLLDLALAKLKYRKKTPTVHVIITKELVSNQNKPFSHEKGQTAIISYHNLLASSTNAFPYRPRLVDRLTKIVLSALCEMKAIKPCTNLNCANATTSSLKVLDQQHPALCPNCIKVLRKTLGIN